MKFNKQKIVEFKSKGRFYITWRKNLKPYEIKRFFYNGCNIKELLPKGNIEYCHSFREDIVDGNRKRGLKYIGNKGTYYMFWTANCFWEYPSCIAVGKVVKGILYLVREELPRGEYNLCLKEIPEEYISINDTGFNPMIYSHSFRATPSHIDEITEEDEKCLEIAYEGVKAFSKLIKEYSK